MKISNTRRGVGKYSWWDCKCLKTHHCFDILVRVVQSLMHVTAIKVGH